MNRYITYIIFSLLLIGCSEQYDESLGLYPTLTPRYMTVTPTLLTYASSAGTQSVNVTSTQTPWKMENGIEWVSLSPTSGTTSETISVGVVENTAGDEVRTGIFYLKADVNDWKYEAPISVTQAGATPVITLSKSEVDFTGTENTESITVSSNCSWSVSSSSDWLTATQKDNIISISVSSNETNSYRTASVSVVHEGTTNTSKKITVRQAPASVNASTETLVFNNMAGNVNVTINSEANWTAATSSSWMEVSPSSGSAGTSTMTVSVSPNTATNERTGYVIISIGGSQRIQIPVRQRGIYIETEQTELAFTANGGSQELTVLSNTSWTISSVPSWITVSPSNGEGDGKVKLTAQENPNTANRSGIIHITQSGLSIDVTITVTQTGKTFDVNTTVLNFEDKQETQTVEILTDGTWNARTDDMWITLSPMSASGNSTLSVTVAENPNDSERSGQVIISMGDKSSTISVIQKGKYFTVSNSLLTYTSKGGSMNIAVTTNDTWTAKIENSPTWLQLSSTSGSGNVDVKVTASDNPSVNSRSATIIFQTTHNQSVRVMVTQDARYLNIDTREVLFYSKGGTSEAITVSTDGTYSISCSDSWLSVNQSSNTFTVTATENTTTDARIGYITIALTDLKEGTYSLTLTVTQLNYGGSFLRKDYGDDINYDNMGTSTGSLTITGFGSDKNYDSTTTSGTTLSVSGFKSDSSWDTSVSSKVTVTITGYNSDTNLDTSTSTSGTVSKMDFEGDANWQ